MKTCHLLLALGVCLATGNVRADSVKMTNGTTLHGRVESMTSLKVALLEENSTQTEIPVNEIVKIDYDGEPPSLKAARQELLRGGYERGAYQAALKALDKVEASRLTRDVVRQDFEFYKALCAAKLASGGTGTIIK